MSMLRCRKTKRGKPKPYITLIYLLLAEKEGFEPPVRLPVHRISSAAHSTTLTFFR